MIEIAGVPVQLPESLLWLDNIMVLFLLSVVFWLLAGYLVYVLFFRFAKRFVRRVRGSLDDTLLDIVRRPLLSGVLIFGLANALNVLALPEVASLWLFRLRNFIITWLVAWAIWRLFNEIVIYYGRRAVMRSSDRVDDILLPILQQFGRIIILSLAVFFGLQQLGIDLTGIWVALGGAAFILAFALQDILGNMFASLAMLVDTPFKYGDLISLAGGAVYRVERIGVRVTELYDTNTHTVIFMPNSSLTGKELTNLTKPTMDLRSHIEITVQQGVEPYRVHQILRDVAESHPNVLSPIPRKLELMRQKLDIYVALEEWERIQDYVRSIKRLEVEQTLDEAIAILDQMLERLADRIDEMEEDGLDETEQAIIEGGLMEAITHVDALAREMTRWIMSLRYRMARPLEEAGLPVDHRLLAERADRYMDLVDQAIAAGEIPLLGTLPAGHISELKVKRGMSDMVRRHGLDGFDRGFRDVQNRRELEQLIRDWDYRIRELREILEALQYSVRSGNEQRLDDAMRDTEDWLQTSFKQLTPEWKYPEVSLLDCTNGALRFRLAFQIDNVNLEYFGRQTRVESELRKEALMALQEQGIAL